ncbi:DoxX family protein [Breoghania sp.]|uniref:DoxX family protein n=1 Tax=Breoghania sp. TaxID=2065378 RepID=UPI00261E2C32|nr:DoxX family protein [Breoghania sp.]MDJ0932466.1 DoxX family protein [Breoghania sp.]
MTFGIFRLHVLFFARLQRLLASWLPGLATRAIFASVLLLYFLNSAMTKVGAGVEGLIHPSVGAYAQILPGMMEQVGYNISRIPFFPYGLIVVAGMWAEFLLPVLIVLGLFIRLASFGFTVFICVMTYVDLTGHHVGAVAIGAFFDRAPDAPIADQRLLWLFPLIYLTIYRAGAFSIDRVLARRFIERMQPW